MATLNVVAETDATPDEVIGALTDFTERRPEIWPYLASRYYEVLEVGENRARIREGTVSGPLKVWAIEEYEWGPGRCRFTVAESNFCKPGSYVEVSASPRSGGGSEVRTHWDRRPSNLTGWMAVVMMKASRGGVLKDSMKKGLANYRRLTK